MNPRPAPPRWWKLMTPEQRRAAAQEPDLVCGLPPLEPSLADQAREVIRADLTPGQLRSRLIDLSLAFEDLAESDQDDTTRFLIYRPLLLVSEYDLHHRTRDELRQLLDALPLEPGPDDLGPQMDHTS